MANKSLVTRPTKYVYIHVGRLNITFNVPDTDSIESGWDNDIVNEMNDFSKSGRFYRDMILQMQAESPTWTQAYTDETNQAIDDKEIWFEVSDTPLETVDDIFKLVPPKDRYKMVEHLLDEQNIYCSDYPSLQVKH